MAGRILCTFPGRAGDLFWALPTIRAIAETTGQAVDLQFCGEFASLVPLLQQQPYLRHLWPDPRWGMSEGWQAPRLPQDHDRVIHLGYRRWPELPLPVEIDQTARVEIELPPLDLARPWVAVKPWREAADRLVIAWTDCYFELKVGLTYLLIKTWHGPDLTGFCSAAPGSRWTTEMPYESTEWLELARRIAAADLVLADCSAPHVLATALGKPVVVVEPMAERLNDIFWPRGVNGPIHLVTGLDGKATWDARHVAETIKEVLDGQH